MRVEKPIGWMLLLWPTLWALWVASDGQPNSLFVWVFSLAVIVMRSAGCVINDYADRKIDPLVERTKMRPLAAGNLDGKAALRLFALLVLVALVLLLMLPSRVWPWSIPAILITVAYPFMKRVIQAPQLVLGVAFSFSMPMVYVACNKPLDMVFWFLFVANFCWVLAFDTIYAMADRADDLKVGVKSTAVYLGELDTLVVGLLQVATVFLLMMIMNVLNLSYCFMVALIIVSGLFVYQQWLIRHKEPAACFQAFLNNAWVGAVIWFGFLTAL